jgi:hypothetical protein
VLASLLSVLLTVTVPVASVVVAPPQEPVPAARFDALPTDPVRVVPIEALLHPDPDALPADAIVEVVGTILDYDPLTDAHAVVGHLDSGRQYFRGPEATIDADGRFRVVLCGRNAPAGLDRSVVLKTDRRPNRALRGAVRSWSSPLDVDSVPYLGFARQWRVRGSGAGPWRVDVGAIEKTPAPRVAAIHVRLPPEEACEGDRYGLGLVVDRGKYPTLGRRFAIPRGRALELFSWSIDPKEVLHVFRDDQHPPDDADESDGLRLWCPRFPVGARVEASLVLHHRVSIELNESADRTADWRGVALLVPHDRLDWIERLEGQNALRTSMDLFATNTGPNAEVGSIVHIARNLGTFQGLVPPTRYELVLIESHGALKNARWVQRLGAIDLAHVEATEVRIVVDPKAETARVVPPPKGPLRIVVVATVLPRPGEGVEMSYRPRALCATAEARGAFALKDWKSVESWPVSCASNGRVRKSLVLREVEVGEEVEVQLFPQLGATNLASSVYGRPVLDPYASATVRVEAVGVGAVQVVDLGTIAPRPAPAVATFSIEGGDGRPVDVTLRALVRGSIRGPFRYTWMQCEPGLVYTLHSWNDERFMPAFFKVRAPGFGLTEGVQFERGAHHRIRLQPLTRVHASFSGDEADTDGETDGDRWKIYFVDWRDHFPHAEGRLIDEWGYGDLYPTSGDVADDFSLAPRTVIELWRHSATVTDGGQPVATVEVDLSTDQSVQLGHWTLEFEQLGADADPPVDEKRER